MISKINVISLPYHFSVLLDCCSLAESNGLLVAVVVSVAVGEILLVTIRTNKKKNFQRTNMDIFKFLILVRIQWKHVYSLGRS